MTAASRAVRIEAPGELRVVAAEPRPPAAGEALIRIAWAGVCGSDREVFAGHRAPAYVRYPVVPGHEWSGVVEETGPGVDPGLVGRKVVGEGFRPCRRCTACRRGETNLCSAGYRETGFTEPGAWADHLTLPADLLHPLPDDADLRAAAVLEPAACVAAACLKAAAVPGERIAVVGAGTLGLLAVQLLAAAGPAELVVVHPHPSRAPLALTCGATRLVSPAEAEAGAVAGFDAVVEAAGATGTARLATRLARRGGRVVLTGLAAADSDPPTAAELVTGQLTVHTVFGASSGAWSHAVRAFAAGELRPQLLITHEFPLDEAGAALAVPAEQPDTAVKVLIRP